MKSMDNYGNVWKIMDNYGTGGKGTDKYRNVWKQYGNLYKFIALYRFIGIHIGTKHCAVDTSYRTDVRFWAQAYSEMVLVYWERKGSDSQCGAHCMNVLWPHGGTKER